MARRTTLLFIVLVIGLFVAVASSGAVAPAYQASVMASFAVIGLFAVPLVMKLGKRPRLRRSRRPRPRDDDGLQMLHRLSAELDLDTPGDFEEPKQEIEVYHWPEALDEGQDPRFLRSSVDEHSIAQHLAHRLVPAPPDTPANETQSAQRDLLAALVREGDNLKALGQLLKLDLGSYGNQLAKGIEAARRNRIEECVLILQLANERLRSEIQSGLAKSLSPLRIRPSFDK